MYIHEYPDWPHFKWDHEKIASLLADVRYLQGRLLGNMETLGFSTREEATLQTLVEDLLKTSEIEGEKLSRSQVRSSLAERLGFPLETVVPVDRHVEGIADMILDATQHFHQEMRKERLCGWHAALFPTGRSGLHPITVGAWRTEKSGAMQVVSGPIGRETVHFQAPEAFRLEKEMSLFLAWFNKAPSTDLVIQAAIAHFWFVTIHPFEDGNGRIARALADSLLARSEKTSQRFYSMSSQIQKKRRDYYDVLERSQKGTLDITFWIQWFLECLKDAITASDEILEVVLRKARFWRLHAEEYFNDRQRKILNRLLDGMHGNLTSSKWAKLGKCSQDTALRDINDLLTRKLLIKEEGGGRNTHYSIKD